MVSLSLFWHRLESLEMLASSPSEWKRRRGIILWGFEIDGEFVPVQLLGSQDMFSAIQGIVGKIRGGLMTLWHLDAIRSDTQRWYASAEAIGHDPKDPSQFVAFVNGGGAATLAGELLGHFRFTSATLAKNISSQALQRCLFEQLSKFDMPFRHPKPQKPYQVVHVGNRRVCALFPDFKEELT